MIIINDEISTIEISKKFAKAARYYGSKAYNTLQAVRKDYPNYTVTQREIKKNENQERYKGLTYQYMERYIQHRESAETAAAVLNEFYEKRLISECHSKRYPTIKKWFLEKYPEVAEFGMKDIKADDPKHTDAANTVETLPAPTDDTLTYNPAA